MKTLPTRIAGGKIKIMFRKLSFVSDLDEETCLVPQLEAENERLQPEENYNFMSECFIMTHRSINLGNKIFVNKM